MERVQPFVDRLQAAGVSVWMDQGNLDAAQQWREMIVKAIVECKVLILLASHNSVHSVHVNREVAIASDRDKHIIPIYLEPVALPAAMEYHIAGLQHISLSPEEGEKPFYKVLRSLSGFGVRVKSLESGGSGGSEQFVNPYNFATAAKDEMFKGREREIVQLLDAIESGTHTCVLGLQRIGKTSLVLEALQDRIEQRESLRDRVLFASLDIQQLGSDDVTYKELFQSIIRAISSKVPTAAGLHSIEAATEAFLSDAKRYQKGRKADLLADCTRLLERIAQSTPQKIVLFIDEFSELCRVIERNEGLLAKNPLRSANLHPFEMRVDVALMRWFSALLKNQALRDKLIFIFAIRPFVVEYDSQHELNVLKLTAPVCLYYLDEEAAKALITEPLRGYVSYEERAVDYLYRLTSGHPYLIQFMLKDIVNRIKQERRNKIFVRDIQDVEERMISEGPAYEAQFEVLDSDYSVDEVMSAKRRNLGRGALSLIAKLGDEAREGWVEEEEVMRSLTGRGVIKEDVVGILSQLKSAKILEDRVIEGRLSFRVSIPLLRKRYVRQNMYLKYFK
jgi:hypothetical protein